MLAKDWEMINRDRLRIWPGFRLWPEFYLISKLNNGDVDSI